MQAVFTETTLKKFNGVYLMNKSDLVDAMAAASGLSKADAGRALDGFTSTITSALQSGQSVTYGLKNHGIANFPFR